MGNTASGRLQRAQDAEAHLKKKVAAVTDENPNAKWKEEWKVALEEMVGRIVVSTVPTVPSNSQGLLIQFHGIPGLALRPAVSLDSGWQFPDELKNSSDSSSSSSMRVRKCLNMQQLPYNLWRDVFQQFYSLPGSNYELGLYYCVERLLLPQVRRRLFLENQVYVLPQHYAPTIFRDVAYDKGWVHLNDMGYESEGYVHQLDYVPPSASQKDSCAIWNGSPNSRRRILRHITTMQCHNFFQLLFRLDKQKLRAAEQLLETITCFVGHRFMVATMTMKTIIPKTHSELASIGPVASETWKQDEIHNGNCQTLEFVKILLPPFSSAADRSNTAILHAKEMSLTSQFTMDELITLFRGVVKINIEYAYLLEDHLQWNFPLPNDHFADPKDLRGRVTMTPIFKEMNQFRLRISTAEQQLIGNNRFPVVLARLVTDYFSFPPCSIDTQQTEWKVWKCPLVEW